MARVYRAVWFVLLVAPAAMAQAPAPQPAAPPAAAPAAQVDVSVPQQATLSGADMLAKAREYRDEAKPVVERMTTMIEQAKGDKDIIRLNCLKDKLDQVKLNTDKMDMDLRALEDAASRGDQGEATHSYTRITILNQNIKTLEAYAEQCVGQGLTYVGATKVVVEVPAGLPKDDGTGLPPVVPGPDLTPRLPVASPYM